MLKRTLLLTLLATGLAFAKMDHFQDLGMQTARLRGLSYSPVPAQAVSQKECSDYLLRLLDKEMEPVQTRKRETFLKQLGLMPEKSSMKKILAELYTDQVRGLYDPHQKRYLVVKGGGGANDPMAAMGAAIGLNTEDILTVHELTHAIQDQHFNLSRVAKGVADNGDHEIAAQSLIEGDASVLMMEWAMKAMGMDTAGIDPAQMGGLNSEEMMMGQSPALARAPRYFRESLSFPYSQGMVLVNALKAKGGWKSVDRAFAKLPESSEQVLHPEKYLRDHPKALDLHVPWMKKGGYKSLGQDTAGEFTVRVWAREMGLDEDAAAGWGGDCYESFEGPAGACCVWTTCWDSERDAKEFEDLAQKGMNKRWGKASRKGGVATWEISGKTSQVERTGSQVTLRLGCPTAMVP